MSHQSRQTQDEPPTDGDPASSELEQIAAEAERWRRMYETAILSGQRAEEELNDIRSRMEAALNAGAIGTWNWNVVEDQFFADASFAAIFSLHPNIVSGHGLHRILNSIHPEDRSRIVNRIQQTLASEKQFEESYRIAQPDGTWKWVTARGQVERDEKGRAVRLPGVVIDITDWKKSEEQLARLTAESEQRRRLYETILSSTPDFVYVFSLDYRILYANDSLLKMWGFSWDETIGKTFLNLGYEAWHAEMHCREIDQVRDTRQPLRGEVPFDGTHGRRIYDYIFVPVFSEDGEVVAVAGTTRDVTQRKRLEDALRESDRRKDEFLAMLAHELRNPLVPIRSGLDLLAMDAHEHGEIIDSMKDQMTHIIRLVDDLLDVSRIMQGKVELRKEQVEIADLCRRSIEIAKPTIKAHHHELITSVPLEPVWLDADPVRLIQVIGNLLNNSSKYMSPGGKIELQVERDVDEARIRVKDYGIGIEPELLPKVFDLFTQSSRSLDRAQGGLGIGLTLVQRLVEMHGGTVSAQSDGIGHGSTFMIRLPISASVGTSSRPPIDPVRQVPRRILVVDDNRGATYVIGKLLEKLGNHQVWIAHDGVSALAKVKEHDPELIFLDIGLPGMDGYEVCRAIRQSSRRDQLLIVALTGYGQEGDRAKSKEAGFDEHLVKPPSIQQIRSVLAHSKLSRS